MDYLNIALIVLVVVAVWAVVEVALTVRSARKNIDEVSSSAHEVIAQTQPIVAKLDGMVDELEPAVKQVPAMAAKANIAMDSANASLDSVNAILSDVSLVSGTAAGVTETVNGAVQGAASSVAKAVKKVVGRGADAEPARTLSAAAGSEGDGSVTIGERPRLERKPTSYVVYGETAKPADDSAAADADESLDLVEVLLDAICEDFGITEDGGTLSLILATGGAHDEQ